MEMLIMLLGFGFIGFFIGATLKSKWASGVMEKLRGENRLLKLERDMALFRVERLESHLHRREPVPLDDDEDAFELKSLPDEEEDEELDT